MIGPGVWWTRTRGGRLHMNVSNTPETLTDTSLDDTGTLGLITVKLKTMFSCASALPLILTTSSPKSFVGLKRPS